MILGVGVDIVEIPRIKESVERFGDRFLRRVFTEAELAYAMGKAARYNHLAARFAAKEAVAKCLPKRSTEGRMTWKSVEVERDSDGKPSVRLAGAMSGFLRSDERIDLSLSHSRDYANAVAIWRVVSTELERERLAPR
ncbi:MAG: holo-[acyl-carrier-protein] synthase [Ignavibacteriales bacterium]|nr:holo-[acyl-carrier-protein] synthase [Ignavibacteriales bacterium]